MSRRHNGGGSIYPVKDGYRGYVWCTNPSGTRYRRYIKGKTYDATQQAWLKLRDQASCGPVSSDVPKLAPDDLHVLVPVTAGLRLIRVISTASPNSVLEGARELTPRTTPTPNSPGASNVQLLNV